jgi:hypothetical protein
LEQPVLQQCIRVPISPHPWQHPLVVVFLMMAILTGVRWNLSVVLICISFMATDGEHFFMCLLAIWISSFEKKSYISCKYLVWYWICEFVIAKLCPKVSEQKWYNNLADEQFCHNIKINSREILQVIKTPNQLINNRWAYFKIETWQIGEDRGILLLKKSTTTQQRIW